MYLCVRFHSVILNNYESRLRLRRKPTRTCTVMDNYNFSVVNIGYVLGIVSIYNGPPPPPGTQFYEKLQRHPTSPHARRGGVRNKKRCANAVVHSLQRGDRCCVCSAMDSSSAVEQGHAFGQEQPPLYITIQKILEKYPDGQIFKVCSMRSSIHPPP